LESNENQSTFSFTILQLPWLGFVDENRFRGAMTAVSKPQQSERTPIGFLTLQSIDAATSAVAQTFSQRLFHLIRETPAVFQSI
jgi:hypothetical protein